MGQQDNKGIDKGRGKRGPARLPRAHSPKLSVVSLVRPPEGVRAESVELLEVRPDSPSLVVCESVAVFLETR